MNLTYFDAAAQLPADAKWSSTFGNPGDKFGNVDLYVGDNGLIYAG